MRFIVLGGGCYGTFYARQLLRARDAGALEFTEIVIADHNPACQAARELPDDPVIRYATSDWDVFFDDYFGSLEADTPDHIVPPPFTPHLALAWLLRRLAADNPAAEWQLEPFRALPGMPFAQQSAGGPLLVSHADWMCPVHCIEPATCPHTKGPRSWDVAETVTRFAEQQLAADGQPIAQIHLFQCLHHAFGVGTYPSAAVLHARSEIAAAVAARDEPVLRFLIGTVSHCHGALHLLRAVTGMEPVSPLQSSTAASPKKLSHGSSRT